MLLIHWMCGHVPAFYEYLKSTLCALKGEVEVMQSSEIPNGSSAKQRVFDKYRKNGPYHWEVLSYNPFVRNLVHLGRYQVARRLLAEALYGITDKRILDMGCGDGVLSYCIAREGGVVSGIDLDKYAIEFARKRTRRYRTSIDFSVQDVCATEFTNDSFDAIVSNEVIEHVPNPEEMLLEMKRILKPDGVAVVSTPIRITKRPLDQYHVNEWFQEDFCDVVSSIFPNVEYRVSHPVAFTDLWYRSGFARRVLQVISVFSNPMCFESDRGIFRQQYAVVRKT